MAHLQAFAHAHWRAILYVLGAWVAAGNAVAKKWPIPPANAPKWKRALHFVAVNLPALGRALQGRTIWGFTFAIPLLSFTLRDDSPGQTGGDHAPPPNGQSGRASVTVLLWLALLAGLCGVALAGTGCATVCSDMTNATCARKVLTGVDAADGAAARLGAAWVHECGSKAQALSDPKASDEAFTQCEKTGAILVTSLQEVVDGVNVAAPAVDVAEAAKSKDYSGILAPVYAAVQALYKAFADAGVKLPAGLIPGVQ